MGAMREADLEQLYARLERPIYNVVYRWVWQPEAAQEIVQEAFVRLWRMRERIEQETVEALVYRIALNLAATHARKRKRWRLLPIGALRRSEEIAVGPEQRLAEREERTRLRAAVESLPDDLRRVVLLCVFSELSYEQIGRMLSIPAGTVGSRRHRALRLLREKLSDDERPVRRTV
jgi:RNA polymerase sigma-70 factor (ECF subfamily)